MISSNDIRAFGRTTGKAPFEQQIAALPVTAVNGGTSPHQKHVGVAKGGAAILSRR